VRYLVAIALVLSLTASTAGASATRSMRTPLGIAAMVESNGAPDLGTAPGNGELIRFIPRARFAVGILLKNMSGERLTITGARVIEPRRTLIHQIGTQFHVWDPPKCPPGAFCPAYGFPLHSQVAHPKPFVLKRGKRLGLELDFRLGSCAQVRGASSAPISLLRVRFRTAHGARRERLLWLRGGQLHLRVPKSCRIRG
jgi:hypothetical protein